MESAKGEARFFNSCVIIYVDGTCEGTLVICTVTLTKVKIMNINLATVLNMCNVLLIIDWFDHLANLLVYCASNSVFRSQMIGIMCCSNQK